MIPASGPGRSRFGNPLILATVAITALAAGAGVAALATAGSASLASTSGQLAATPSPSPSVSRPGYGTPGPGHRFSGGSGGGFGSGVAGALHGQFVVPRSGGGYQTEDTQRGSVTAVSTSSITVKSADGFTKTFQGGDTARDHQADKYFFRDS